MRMCLMKKEEIFMRLELAGPCDDWDKRQGAAKEVNKASGFRDRSW